MKGVSWKMDVARPDRTSFRNDRAMRVGLLGSGLLSMLAAFPQDVVAAAQGEGAEPRVLRICKRIPTGPEEQVLLPPQRRTVLSDEFQDNLRTRLRDIFVDGMNISGVELISPPEGDTVELPADILDAEERVLVGAERGESFHMTDAVRTFLRDTNRPGNCVHVYFVQNVSIELADGRIRDRDGAGAFEQSREGLQTQGAFMGASLLGRPEQDLKRTFVHEVGHALGLGHNPQDDNLMREGGQGTALIPGQREQIRQNVPLED